MLWVSGKSVEWHQQLYSLLYTELATVGSSQRLKDLRVTGFDYENVAVRLLAVVRNGVMSSRGR
jgi:hypothetical protein